MNQITKQTEKQILPSLDVLYLIEILIAEDDTHFLYLATHLLSQVS